MWPGLTALALIAGTLLGAFLYRTLNRDSSTRETPETSTELVKELRALVTDLVWGRLPANSVPETPTIANGSLTSFDGSDGVLPPSITANNAREDEEMAQLLLMKEQSDLREALGRLLIEAQEAGLPVDDFIRSSPAPSPMEQRNHNQP